MKNLLTLFLIEINRTQYFYLLLSDLLLNLSLNLLSNILFQLTAQFKIKLFFNRVSRAQCIYLSTTAESIITKSIIAEPITAESTTTEFITTKPIIAESITAKSFTTELFTAKSLIKKIIKEVIILIE